MFSDLKKCGNSFCQKYVHEKDKDMYKYKDLNVCSRECIHLAELEAYANITKEKLDMNIFLEKIRNEFEKYKEELLFEFVLIVTFVEIPRRKI